MIVYRCWLVRKSRSTGTFYDLNREGWFLLGLFPLYIRDLDVRDMRKWS